MLKSLQNTYGAWHEEVVSWRRSIHQNPETAFEEEKTASFVASKLLEWGIEHQTGIAQTGVVGIIRCKDENAPCIALRADMDALPIQEESDIPYKSQVEGKMHACGHDYHTSSLLATARLLQHHKEDLNVHVKLLFQPSEERSPGGASVMIQEGVLQNPDVLLVIGQHVSPDLPTGTIGYRPGPFMASANEIHATVYGKGGHAAFPQNTLDPIPIAIRAMQAVEERIRKAAKPQDPLVIQFGRFIADGATNVIPEKVELSGTLRTFDENLRQEALAIIKRVFPKTIEAAGGQCDLSLPSGYPFVQNHEALTQWLADRALECNGKEQVKHLPLRLSAEDFGFFTQKLPSCFYRIGTGNEKKGTTHGLHTPQFNVDEEAFKVSAPFMAYLALSLSPQEVLGWRAEK